MKSFRELVNDVKSLQEQETVNWVVKDYKGKVIKKGDVVHSIHDEYYSGQVEEMVPLVGVVTPTSIGESVRISEIHNRRRTHKIKGKELVIVNNKVSKKNPDAHGNEIKVGSKIKVKIAKGYYEVVKLYTGADGIYVRYIEPNRSKLESFETKSSNVIVI